MTWLIIFRVFPLWSTSLTVRCILLNTTCFCSQTADSITIFSHSCLFWESTPSNEWTVRVAVCPNWPSYVKWTKAGSNMKMITRENIFDGTCLIDMGLSSSFLSVLQWCTVADWIMSAKSGCPGTVLPVDVTHLTGSVALLEQFLFVYDAPCWVWMPPGGFLVWWRLRQAELVEHKELFRSENSQYISASVGQVDDYLWLHQKVFLLACWEVYVPPSWSMFLSIWGEKIPCSLGRRSCSLFAAETWCQSP